jgi:glycine/D-amino acid oxidase-like deaminating enzyme/nitrite reductase/ring-hydroxylating ferredoxin subunit
MATSAAQPSSLWLATRPADRHPALGRGERIHVDVAVIGGGIAGVTTALKTKRTGATVAVIEADRIGSGVTGHSTVKVTAGHGAIYQRIAQAFGVSAARAYAESQQAGLADIEALITQLSIECDFEHKANFVYGETVQDAEKLRREADVEAEAGLPTTFVLEGSLPIPISGAVRMDGQAQFHPVKYVAALAARIPGDGSHVFEGTRVLGVHGRGPMTVATERGDLTADRVVVATNFPILDRGFFFARVFPRREYAVAGRIDPDRLFDDMWINVGQPTRSARLATYGGEPLVIGVGESHKTGEGDSREHYAALEQWLTETFGVTRFEFRWSSQDNHSADSLPFIGRHWQFTDRVFVATGFGSWGMTNGTVAGMLLSDLLGGRDNPWAELYDSRRLAPRQEAVRVVKENAKVATHFLGDRVRPRPTNPDDLGPDEGAVLRVGVRHVAAYRDEGGTLHAVSARCTHLGCLVAWNAAERSWDCPCHGSRYDVNGNVLHPPAVRPLKPEAI